MITRLITPASFQHILIFRPALNALQYFTVLEVNAPLQVGVHVSAERGNLGDFDLIILHQNDIMDAMALIHSLNSTGSSARNVEPGIQHTGLSLLLVIMNTLVSISIICYGITAGLPRVYAWSRSFFSVSRKVREKPSQLDHVSRAIGTPRLATQGSSAVHRDRIDLVEYFCQSFSNPLSLIQAMAQATMLLSDSRGLEWFKPGSCSPGSDWDFYMPHSHDVISTALAAFSRSGVVWDGVLEPVRRWLAASDDKDEHVSRSTAQEYAIGRFSVPPSDLRTFLDDLSSALADQACSITINRKKYTSAPVESQISKTG